MLLATEVGGSYFISRQGLTLGYIGPKLTFFQDPLGALQLQRSSG